MMRAAITMLFGAVIAGFGIAIATYLKLASPDDWLVDIVAMSQVVILGVLGLGIIEDSASDFKKRLANTTAKRRLRVRR
jgi:hypothetical protein